MDAGTAVISYVGIGSNIGDRESHLRLSLKELAALPTIEIGDVSSIYETAPVGVTEQQDFLNLVVLVRTTLPPNELLDILQGIENKMGRVRTVRWGPRVIDLDLLVYGGERIALPELTVPHPRLFERAFTLVPLAEIAPELIIPGASRTTKDLAEKFLGDGNIRRIEVV